MLLGDLVFLNVLADDAGHRGTQAREVGATVTLGNVVGEAQHALVVAVVPLHGHFHTDAGAGDAAVAVGRALAIGVKGVGVQHFFVGVDEVHKAFDATGAREVVFFAGALVFEANAHAIVQERQLAQTLGQNFVMEIGVLREDFYVGQKVHFGAAFVGGTGDAHGRNFHTVHGFEQTVLHKAFGKIDLVHFAFAAHRQAQPFAQRVHARHAHAVQATRDLVAVLVELAACVQFCQSDFRCTALGLVLVVHLHAGGDAAAVVGDADGVVRVDGDHDVVAVAGQRFVDRVVHNLEHQVVQTGAV